MANRIIQNHKIKRCFMTSFNDALESTFCHIENENFEKYNNEGIR